MKPAICPVDAAPGDGAMFRALAEAPGAEQWIVLHSLMLADHVRQVDGEADFVVIVPEHGVLIISPRREDSTAAITVGPWLQQNLVPADGLPAKAGRVLYSTINAFKRLDAPAVVVTDLDEAGIAESFDSLLYVGLTSATDRLAAIIEAATLRHAIGASRERT